MSLLDLPEDDPKRRARRPLLMFVLVTLAVGALGSLFTKPSISTWYAALNHPGIAPPDWLFAPVWTALYVLMAVAAWQAWRITGSKSPAMISYAAQLGLNLGWSVLFFGLHEIGSALAEIGLLWLAILATTVLFWRADRIAGLLMLPYLAWTGFAVALNLAFQQLNP